MKVLVAPNLKIAVLVLSFS